MPGPLVVNYLLLISVALLFIFKCCCTRVLLYVKTLKEIENEETRIFCQLFVIGGISIENEKLKMKKQGFFVNFLLLVAFQLRGPGPPGPPPGYAYDFEIRSRP